MMSIRRVALPALAASFCSPFLIGAARAPDYVVAKLDLAQVLEKNAAARGGLEAWRKVQTMIWSGYVERADRSGPRLPFMFEQKRPNLTRFEIVADKQKSVRVFDGKQGWKLRASATGRPEVQPYTDEERRAASDALVIEGPVLDAAAKRVEMTLDGLEEVEGRQAWRLRAKLPSGTTQRVWIDAETFLELKYDRPARDAAGRPTTVAVYLRNYQAFEGLQIPFTIETGTPGGGPVADRLVIERIAIDAVLPDGMFARPGLRTARRGITVDTRAPPAERSGAALPRR
jgi:outer membrane lipoprotein-sorting protein